MLRKESGPQNPFRNGEDSAHELPQGDCLIPIDNLLIIEREWVREREGGKKEVRNVVGLESSEIFQFCGGWPSAPAARMSSAEDCLSAPSLFHFSLSPSFPHHKLLCPWIWFFFSHLLLWQSFNTVWLEFLSPVCTVCSKYLSTHWHSARRDLGNLTHGNDFN